MKKKPIQVKIPRSTSSFVKEPEKGRSDFAKLFSRGKLKQKLDGKTYIKAANLLATGFAGKEYHGKRKRKRVRQAKNILQDFYDFSVKHGKVKIIRPSKKDRHIYAKQLGVVSKFKVYPLPILNDEDVYTLKNGRLTLEGKIIRRELYLFPDRKKAAKSPRKETQKLFKQISIDYGDTLRDMKLVCGEYRSHFSTDALLETNEEQYEEIEDTIALWFNKYKHYEEGRGDKAEKWLLGIEVTIFIDQEKYNDVQKHRGGKQLEERVEKPKPKPKKKRKSKQARKHDRRKGR